MRLIKMFGLAMMAAVAAMALVGASSASATSDTALCKVDPSPNLACPSGQLVSHVHVVDPAARLLNNIREVVCNALFLGEVQTAGLLATAPNPLKIKGNLTYTNCTPGCAAEEISGHTLINALKTGTELATVTGEGEVLVVCGLVLHCEYDGTNLVGHGLGGLLTGPGEKGHVTFNEAVVNVSNDPLLLCPNTAKLDALFVSLNKEYLTS